MKNSQSRGKTIEIGGAEVRLLDMTSAFGVFANEGKKFPVHSIRKIADSKDRVLTENFSEEYVLDPEVARKINSVLSDNVARTPIFGPRSPLFIPNNSVAAKTGTTQEFRDAWTVGYTPNIAVGVWAGNNDSRPMKAGSDGVFVAAPIWRNFMDKVLPCYSNDPFIAYENEAHLKELALKYKEEKPEDKKEKKKKKKHD